MDRTFKAKIVTWEKMPKWTKFAGTAKPLDPEIFKYTQNVLISEEMLHRSGRKDLQLKVGDIIEIEIISYAYRIFEYEPAPES